jgi:RNA polymerase sigma-70 factor (ECF subfamily)
VPGEAVAVPGLRRTASPRPAALGAREERRLVRAAQRGDREAVEVLFRAHWPACHRAAALITRDAAAAEDIAQEAFLSAVRALDRFDRRRPFAPWLTRIVVNRAIDWTRSRTLRREDLGDAPVAAGDPVEGLDDELRAALARLPADQRAVVVLRHLLGYTPREIGRMLDLPTGTVNSRMRRGLDTLEGELA